MGVGGPERHSDGLQRVEVTVPMSPVKTRFASRHAAVVAVATVGGEVATVVPPEAATKNGTVTVRPGIVVAVISGESTLILKNDGRSKRVTGVSAVATDV